MVAARIHSILRHTNLVTPGPHSLLDLLSIPPNSPRLLNHLTDLVISTATFALKRPLSKPVTDAFPAFVQNILDRASATTALVLSTMVYISRAKELENLDEFASEDWLLERIFLGAIVCANKYLNDACLKNHQWATVTQALSCRDMGRIERDWYDVLKWKLSISEADILQQYPALSGAIPIVIRAATEDKSPASEWRATSYDDGAFDAFPSDVHSSDSSSPSSASSSDSSGSESSSPSSLSSSSGGYSPHTPGTSGVSPTRGQAFGVLRDSRGRPKMFIKSAVGHRSQSPALRHSSVRITRCARQRQAPYFPPRARQR